MREMGVRGILVYCAGHRSNHSIAISGDQWPDDLCCPTLSPALLAGPAIIAGLT
jgi:hypothetical protein